MSTSASSLLESLPLRPPTPPRDISNAIDDAISFLDDGNEVEQLTSKPRLEQQVIATSELTPTSSQDTTSLSTLTKKVGFSLHSIDHKNSRPEQLSSPSTRLAKGSPSSAKDAKPLKSILKPSSAPPPTPEELASGLGYFSSTEPQTPTKMLLSACQQLAGPSRSQRLDAYSTLNGALQAYENVPETTALLQKIRPLTQFLSRDIISKDSCDTLDTQIVNQALKLTSAILYSQELSHALDDEFRHFLLDRCIAVLEQTDVPKQMVKAHMHLLTQQRFRAPVMNSGRADRILNALQTIEDRCSGNNVVATRLVIYSRLLEQAPAVMLTRARDWLEHVFHGMLSSIKDVRVRAIDACTKAGLLLGLQPHAAKVLSEMFETEVEDGQTYCDYLRIRLLEMISANETGPYVPQIWSAVVLFYRSKRRPLEKWAQYKSWLTIIQKCINASDLTIRYQSTLAWNKLVFAIMPDSSTPKNVMTILKLPICSGMDKRGADKYSKQIRNFALDSYYNLLHYGLRPGLSNEELDNAWEAFVEPVLSSAVSSGGKGWFLTCHVLHGLLNGNSGVWNGEAAMQLDAVKPEDLPKLDPRWVRSRLAKILKLLEPAIFQSMLCANDANSALDATWHALMQALADARKQEVKTTIDLKDAIALLVGLFRRLWNGCDPKHLVVEGGYWIERYVALLDTMLVGIGAGPFTEDILATTMEDIVEVAPTPSHRPSKHHSAPKSPLVILFSQFYRPPATVVISTEYFSSAHKVLEQSLASKASSTASLDLLCRSLHAWTNIKSPVVGLEIESMLWVVVAAAAIRRLKVEIKQSNSQESQPLGQALRSGMDILIYGLRMKKCYKLPEKVSELYHVLVDTAKSGGGEGGVVLAVLEPFAKALRDASEEMTFRERAVAVTSILESNTWPKQRQSMEQARKALWGVGLTPLKNTVFDPFDHVYSLIVELMSDAYDKLDCFEADDFKALRSLFTSILSFLESSPISVLATALRKVQSGFTIWIEDSASNTSALKDVADMVRAGWQVIVQLLQSIPTKESTLLKALEPLLVAGFASPHRAIVNDTIAFWNETFGAEESLEYPTKLESILRARVAEADIALPTFPDVGAAHVHATLPAFFDSQSQESFGLQPPKFSGVSGRGLLSPGGQRRINHLTTKSSPISRNVGSPSPAKGFERRAASSTPKPRLRHDDSQIQFAPIDSSPLPPADESQYLTEHQKEVKARQQLDAQIFPEISSSPIAHSTALPRGVSKRLDFGSIAGPRKDDGFGTPAGLPDANGLQSDDMPSSPTPSSNRDASQGAIDVDEHEEEEVNVHDPPSSPPRAANYDDNGMEEPTGANTETDLDTTPVDISDLPELPQETAQGGSREEEASLADVDEAGPDTEDMVSASEFPSDSGLPTVQLQLEEELAQEPPPVPSSQPGDAQDQVSGGTASGEASQDLAAEAAEDEITRVEDSFVRPVSQDESQSTKSGEPGPRPGRKRKRGSAKNFTVKKQKQQSPLQRVWSTFGFGQQEEDDDDIGDEIVVASSRPTSSPAKSIEVNDETQDDEVVVERSVLVKDEPEVMQPPPKRGRGRPRKSETPTPSQTEAAPTGSLKRKASVLSNASLDDSQTSLSFVKDTPAPTKKKGRGRGRPSHASQERPGASGSTRTATPVVIHRHEEDLQTTSPEDRSEEEDATAVQDRVILTPRSILGRLKDALSDFKGMILGSQEEREFDNVLFELRKETHEAARRAREMS